jgi:hypothetical protein
LALARLPLHLLAIQAQERRIFYQTTKLARITYATKTATPSAARFARLVLARRVHWCRSGHNAILRGNLGAFEGPGITEQDDSWIDADTPARRRELAFTRQAMMKFVMTLSLGARCDTMGAYAGRR